METISFTSMDSVDLEGTLELPAKATQACVILCHGITVDREEGGVFTQLAADLAAAGLASFRFDFRGHGKSGMRFEEMTVMGECLDLKAALGVVRERGFGKLALVGASFGGGTVSYVAAEWPAGVRALVLWNAALEYKTKFFKERAAKPFEIDGKQFLMNPDIFEGMTETPPGEALLEAGLPSLFIHGDKDDMVPYDNSVKYAAMVPGAAMMTIEGAGHGFHDKKDCSKACAIAVEFLVGQLLK
jgi:pimeloyl-ACP methyl ester carboxylesterase